MTSIEKRTLHDLDEHAGHNGRGSAIVAAYARTACSRRFIAQCWRPVSGVGRPPTDAYKETKAQRPGAGDGGVHSTVSPRVRIVVASMGYFT